jgi:uncharacterized membrane protein
MLNDLDAKKSDRFFFIVVGLIIVLGVFFRFYNLAGKTYWHDEVYSSIRVAGYNGDIVVEEVFNGKIISPQDLLKYQKISPNLSLGVTWQRFVEHPEHPPLFYLSLRFWQDIFGSSITVSRSLAAVFSLLIFPGIFWLCWELFNSKKVGWVAVAMTAISPVHIIYAQEARQYSLWAATTLFATAALVRAMKLNKVQWWLVYIINLTLSFYTVLLSAFVAIAHGIYVIVVEKFRPTKRLIAFILSGICAVILFIPWIIVVIQNHQELQNKTDWTNISRPFIELLASWELHLNAIFIDLHPALGLATAPRLTPIILVFLGYTLYFLYRRTPIQTWLLVVSLIFIPALGLILPDLISGGQKSIMVRYFMPSVVGIQVAIAYWLVAEKYTYHKIKLAIATILIVSGIASAIVSSQTPTWWSKVVGYHNPEIAALANQFDRPLIISNNYDINVGNLISLSYLFKPQVRLMLVTKPTVPTIPEGNFSDILVWNVGDTTLEEFKQKNNCQLERVGENYYPTLWLVKK